MSSLDNQLVNCYINKYINSNSTSGSSSPMSVSSIHSPNISPSPTIFNDLINNSTQSQDNILYNQYVIYQQLFNNFINTFNFKECFKSLFIDMIDKHIKIFGIDLVFNSFFFSFILDCKIMNKGKYIKYNEFNTQEKYNYIKNTINHITEFYENDIIELMKYNLYNQNISFIEAFNLFYKLHFISNIKKKSHINDNFKQLCYIYSLIRRPIVYHFVKLNPITEINRIVNVCNHSDKNNGIVGYNINFETFLIKKYKPFYKDYNKYAKLYIFGDYLYRNDKHIYNSIDFQINYKDFIIEIPDDIDEQLSDNDDYSSEEDSVDTSELN